MSTFTHENVTLRHNEKHNGYDEWEVTCRNVGSITYHFSDSELSSLEKCIQMVDKQSPKGENEVYQPDVNQWWMEEPYCLMDAGNDWISVYDPQAIIAEARRRTLEEVRGIVGDSKTHFYWVGEDPETEETREMDADENSAWGCEMSFAYNAALDSLLSKLDKMK